MTPTQRAGAGSAPRHQPIYTRTGDSGTMGLLGPGRVRKDHPRVEAYGQVDELNAALGWAAAQCRSQGPALTSVVTQLEALQHRLFALGAQLAVAPGSQGGGAAEPGDAMRGVPRLTEADVRQVEEWIDAAGAELAPLHRFILPGGNPAAAALHLARTVARRAERHLVALAAREPVAPEALSFLNRLSDLLFVMARVANHQAGTPEAPWQPHAKE